MAIKETAGRTSLDTLTAKKREFSGEDLEEDLCELKEDLKEYLRENADDLQQNQNLTK